MSYLQNAARRRRQTPQTERMPGRTDQVENSAGGYVWAVDSLTRLRRFLILGSEGGSYYAGEQKLTTENVQAVSDALDEHGVEAVELIAQVSDAGRAPKNDPALFALAMAASHPDDAVRSSALWALPRVARTGTHLFTFIEFAEQMRGWGRQMKMAVAQWFNGKPIDRAAYQAIKYRQRGGWSQRDALRLSKPKPVDAEHDALYAWIVGKDSQPDHMGEGGVTIDLYQQAQRAESPAVTAELVREADGRLPREALQTEHTRDPEVWRALLDVGMPYTALIRNLATMTRRGVFDVMGADAYSRLVLEQLGDAEAITRSRVHPLNILHAMMTYQAGVSVRGDSTWDPITALVEALHEAFYAAFGNVPKTRKRTVLAVDASGSMSSSWGGYVGGIPGFYPSIAAAAMAMVFASSGDPYAAVAIGDHLETVDLSARRRLDDVLRDFHLNMGMTDLALPMLWAESHGIDADAFVILTDNETWRGGVHPVQALNSYRRSFGKPDARMVTVGLVSNGFTIADPQDAGTLDAVGFDTATPTIVQDFIAGEV